MAFLNQSKYKTRVEKCFSVAGIQDFLKETSVIRMAIFPFSCALAIQFCCVSQAGFSKDYARGG